MTDGPASREALTSKNYKNNFLGRGEFEFYLINFSHRVLVNGKCLEKIVVGIFSGGQVVIFRGEGKAPLRLGQIIKRPTSFKSAKNCHNIF